MSTILIEKGYDNDFEIRLFEKNKSLSVEKMEQITGVGLVYEDRTYLSSEYPSAFDFSSYKDKGIFTARLGRIPFDTSEKKKGIIDVVVFFTSHPNGVKFFEFKAEFE